MNRPSIRWRTFATGIMILSFAAAFSVVTAIANSTAKAPAIPAAVPIGDLPATTANADEQKSIQASGPLAERVGITDNSFSSAREVLSSSAAGRMVFIPGSQGGCLVMSGNVSCGDPTDATVPLVSMFMSVDSSPYLVGGGVTPADVSAVIFEDSQGRNIVLPVHAGILAVDVSDRLTRDAKYVGTQTR